MVFLGIPFEMSHALLGHYVMIRLEIIRIMDIEKMAT